VSSNNYAKKTTPKPACSTPDSGVGDVERAAKNSACNLLLFDLRGRLASAGPADDQFRWQNDLCVE
jgi:hypothetical protein